MKNNYFLIIIVLLVIFIASLINYYDPKLIDEVILTGDFCTDFHTIFPGCWCRAENNIIYQFNENISNELIATNIIDNYYKLINETCNNPACYNLGNGFYNCFCEYHMGTLRNNGDFYKTECGV
jgi:hypothetical protein